MPNPILRDFVCADQRALAFFEGDRLAAEIAGRMSKHQRRLFFRFKRVPPAFYAYLQRAGIIRHGRIPQGGTTLDALLDLLRFYPYDNEQAQSIGEYLYREIIKGEFPGLLNKAFALSDHVWERGATYGRRSRRQKESKDGRENLSKKIRVREEQSSTKAPLARKGQKGQVLRRLL